MDSISNFAWISKLPSKGNLRWPWIWLKDVKIHTRVASRTLTGSAKREKSFHCRTFLVSGDAVKGQEGSCLTSSLSLRRMAYKSLNSCVSDWVKSPEQMWAGSKSIYANCWNIISTIWSRAICEETEVKRVLLWIIGFTQTPALQNTMLLSVRKWNL